MNRHKNYQENISESNLTMYNKDEHVNQVDFIPGLWARRLRIVKNC